MHCSLKLIALIFFSSCLDIFSCEMDDSGLDSETMFLSLTVKQS